MKRIITAAVLCLLLTGCTIPPLYTPDADPVMPSTQAPTNETSAATEEAPTEAPTTAPTEPEHSSLYLPDVTVADAILYFNEVCLDAEYSASGNAALVQKWLIPIRYYLYGTPTNEDLALLESYCAQLNVIEGFPGISQADSPEDANLAIHFCSATELVNILGNEYVGCDGGVRFWYYNDTNDIYDATICIRNDIDQYLRNSVIQEEIYNGLGPVQDTALRPDSMIYSEFSQPQALTDVDVLILQLLYNPRIACGMNQQECEAVIRELYY